MSAVPFDDLTNIPAIQKQLEDILYRVEHAKGSVSGNKEQYLSRLLMVMDTLRSALQHASAMNTPTNVFVNIRASLNKIDETIGPTERPNYDRLNELTDELMSYLPWLRALDHQTIRDHEKELDKALIRFNGKVEERTHEITTATNFLRERAEGQLSGVIQHAEKDLSRIKKLTSSVEELSQFVSGKTLSNEFASQADIQRTGKRLWTAITAVLAVSTVGMLGYFLYWQLHFAANPGTIDFSLLTTKVLVTVTLGLLTRWASKRANHHLSDEAKYRRLALNMANLDVAVATLDEPDRTKIKTFVLAKLLSDYPAEAVDAAFDSMNIHDLLKSTQREKSLPDVSNIFG